MNENRSGVVLGITLTVVLAAALLSGCGGTGGNGDKHPMRGEYRGETLHDDTGRITFRVNNAGELTGQCSMPPLCGQRFQITGTVDEQGVVAFEGTGCSITFAGTGFLDGWSGNGSWTGSDGSDGGWWVHREIDIGPIF
jgi:hypothetical protein